MSDNKNESANRPITLIAFGCDHYEHLKNLSGVGRDLHNIKDIFCGQNDYALFDEKNYFELYNGTSEELRKMINTYIINCSVEGDILIIYFAGHGTAIGRDNFGFCMRDAYLHPEESIVLPTSVVSISEIIASLHIKSVHPIFLIDSCYSGMIAKQLEFGLSEMSLEINKNLVGTFASDFAFLTVTDDITPARDGDDGGILTRTLQDICKQGFGEKFVDSEFVTVGELLNHLVIGIKANGEKRARFYFPSTEIADIYIIKNTQYVTPEIPENQYSFTSIYKDILDALWNDGNEVELDPAEILERTGSQSAYGNHRKLSFSPWNLVEDSPVSNKRKLTTHGKDFIKGKIQIPRVVIVNKETQKCRPHNNGEMISYSDF